MGPKTLHLGSFTWYPEPRTQNQDPEPGPLSGTKKLGPSTWDPSPGTQDPICGNLDPISFCGPQDPYFISYIPISYRDPYINTTLP